MCRVTHSSIPILPAYGAPQRFGFMKLLIEYKNKWLSAIPDG